MKDYFARRISAVRITDATGSNLPADVVDRVGRSLITGEVVVPPVLGPSIANRTYTVGDAPVTIDLSERFIGAISYGMTPTNITGVTRSGAIVTINPTATRATTSITVSGSNSGGTATMQFTLTINAVAPALTTPLLDQSLDLGSPNVTVPLGSYFTGAASYSVSPAGQGVTISGSTMTISAATERSGTYTVTATNSTGQSVSDAFALTVAAVPVAPSIVTQPTVSGSNVAGSTLTSSLGTATGTPTPTAARQWLSNGTAVAGATGASFDTTGRSGQSISLRVTWTNGVGAPAVATTTAIDILSAPVITTQATITGSTDTTGVLTLAPGAATGAPTPTATQQWRRDGANIVGQTGLTVDKSVHGAGVYTAVVTWTNSVGSATSTTNAITVATATVAPSITTQPTISGDTTVGSTLTASPGTATGTPAPTATYQWRLDGVTQAGQTGLTFVRPATVGAVPSVVVTWANGTAPNATATATAAATVAAVVAPARTAQATITPATGPVGTVFTITPATFSGTTPLTRAGTLTQAGASVATRTDGASFTFTSTAAGSLAWSETATNSAGSATGSATATVQVAPPVSTLAAEIFAVDEGAGETVTSESGNTVFTKAAGATWRTAPVGLTGTTNRHMTTPALTSMVATDMILGAVVNISSQGNQSLLAITSGPRRVFNFSLLSTSAIRYLSYQNTSGTSVTSPTGLVTAGTPVLLTAFVTDTTVQIRVNGEMVHEGAFSLRNRDVPADGSVPLVVAGREDTFNAGVFVDPLLGDLITYGFMPSAASADVSVFEQDLWNIATAKGVTLPALPSSAPASSQTLTAGEQQSIDGSAPVTSIS